MRLVQYRDPEGARRVGLVEDAATLRRLDGTDSVYGLAHRAAAERTTVAALAEEFAGETRDDYRQARLDGRVLVPIDHPVDAARCTVSGTGLTHLGLGAARDELLERLEAPIDARLEPALALLRSALRGGRPEGDELGAQPEWFYKGDGEALLASGADVEMPSFAEDCGDEAELAALYVVDGIGNPCRIGFALANEFTDHAVEEASAFYLGHAKLRPCALGPELVLGGFPARVSGTSRILRGGEPAWERSFVTGDEVFAHSLENLERHHFKYRGFRRAGDVHVHLLGAAAQSAMDGFKTRDGDVFEIEAEGFGEPLRNRLRGVDAQPVRVKAL